MLIRLVGQHVQLELGIACSGRIGSVFGYHRVLSVQVVVFLCGMFCLAAAADTNIFSLVGCPVSCAVRSVWLPASTLLGAFAGALGSEARAVKCSTHRASVDACVKRLHDGHVRKGVRLG